MIGPLETQMCLQSVFDGDRSGTHVGRAYNKHLHTQASYTTDGYVEIDSRNMTMRYGGVPLD